MTAAAAAAAETARVAAAAADRGVTTGTTGRDELRGERRRGAMGSRKNRRGDSETALARPTRGSGNVVIKEPFREKLLEHTRGLLGFSVRPRSDERYVVRCSDETSQLIKKINKKIMGIYYT